jgi:steroid delta-isomerase-like uncharacterized protein
MKKLFLLGLSIVLFTSCQKQEQRYFDESTEIETVKQLFQHLEDGNLDEIRTLYNDTAKVYVNSTKSISIDESVAYDKESRELFSMYTFKDSLYPEMIISKKGHKWVNTWPTWVGKVKGHDEEITIAAHATYRFEGGKIVEEYVYYDTSPIEAALKEVEAMNNMTVEDKTITAQVDKFVGEFLNKHDASVLGDLLADNFVRYMNDVKDASNANELATNMNVFFTGFPDFHIKLLHRSPIFNNTQFLHWEMTGTNSGEFAGSPATGKKVKVSGLSRIHFNGSGKVDEENVFYNELDLMKQLGKTLN